MNSQQVIDRLRQHEAALRARGVSRAALFGSVARGEARPESDVDIMIELDPAAELDVYAYSGLKNYIASLFDGKVDVVQRCALKAYIKPVAEAETLYAF